MDDAARPYSDDRDAAQEPAVAGDPPVSDYAPDKRPAVTPRLGLPADPFGAGAQPAAFEPAPPMPAPAPEDAAPAPMPAPAPAAEDAAPAPAPESAEPAPAPEQPSLELPIEQPAPLFAIEEAAEPSPLDAAPAVDEPTGEPIAEPASDQDADESTAEPAEAEEPSLEDMVSGLAEEPAEAGESAGDAEAADGEGGSEEDADAGSSWRDVAATEAVADPVQARTTLAARLPFWIYGGVWAAFAGTMTYLMWPVADKAFVDSPFYAYFVFGGAGLVAAGLVLGLVVFFAVKAGSSRTAMEGLGRAVALRTAGWTAVGVLVWWAAMFALDLHRTGVIG